MEVFLFYIGVLSIGSAVLVTVADLIEFITRK